MATINFSVVAPGGAQQLSESPVWCPRTRRLWWVDSESARLYSLDPISRVRTRNDLPGKAAGCCVLRASGGLLVAVPPVLVDDYLARVGSGVVIGDVRPRATFAIVIS